MFYEVSDGLLDVWDVESYGCWMFGMWNDQVVGCPGCEMFGMLNVLGCRMWNGYVAAMWGVCLQDLDIGMWDFWYVRCS